MNKPYAEKHFSEHAVAATSAAVAAASSGTAKLSVGVALTQKSLISPSVFRSSLRVAEMLLLFVTGLLAATYHIGAAQVVANHLYFIATSGTAIATVLIFDIAGAYRRQAIASPVRTTPRLVIGWSAAVGLLTAGLFFLKVSPEFSRIWLAIWFVAGLAAILATRIAASRLMQSWARDGRLNRHAVIIGGGQPCRDLISQLENDTDTDLRICGIFDDRSEERSPASIAGYPKLGSIDELTAFARENRIDVVIVSLPFSAEGRLLQVAKVLRVLPVDVRLSTAGTKLRFRPYTYDYIGRIPFLPLADKPISDWGNIAKLVLDRSVAFAALIALAPLMAAVAIAIRWESRGPIFFRQKRYGYNNELIDVLKFRSMYIDQCDANASRLVTKEDPRVTRVGHFIRRTSIDELPQLFNVLKGDLSLVGPRPHALQAKAADRLYNEAVEGYFARHRVRPGITGWAQINGWRGETDTEEKIQKRVEHDLDYIENWSLTRDIYILLRTPLALLKSDNAY